MSASPATIRGVVAAAFGRHYEVRPIGHDGAPDFTSTPLRCDPRGKKSVYACGDEVEVVATGNGQGVIANLQPRRNLLWRSDAFRQKLIAANLGCIAIVVATEPGFSGLLISRCIAAAEHQNLRPIIVLNKIDLVERLAAARAQLAPFAALGYRIIELSAREGAEALMAELAGERSILVGQSGMGKSTLVNALIPDAQAATREISTALDSGKHTTTHARLYELAAGGWLVDSPGLQAFGLAHLSAEELAQSSIELRPLLGRCRFRDCHHDAEPGCALREAVNENRIDRQRFEHYQSIRDEIEHAGKQARGW